jgi:hypothetical protein
MMKDHIFWRYCCLIVLKNDYNSTQNSISFASLWCIYLKIAVLPRDGPISIPKLDTIDTRVLKKSIDTGKKYRLLRYFWACDIFSFWSADHHENDTKSLNRRKYYQSSSFSVVLNGPWAGSEFVVMLVTIEKINVLKTYSIWSQRDENSLLLLLWLFELGKYRYRKKMANIE